MSNTQEFKQEISIYFLNNAHRINGAFAFGKSIKLRVF